MAFTVADVSGELVVVGCRVWVHLVSGWPWTVEPAHRGGGAVPVDGRAARIGNTGWLARRQRCHCRSRLAIVDVHTSKTGPDGRLTLTYRSQRCPMAYN